MRVQAQQAALAEDTTQACGPLSRHTGNSLGGTVGCTVDEDKQKVLEGLEEQFQPSAGR